MAFANRTKSDYKYFQVRLPTPLHEEFFCAFPGHGERSRLITEIIAMLVSRQEKVIPLAEEVLDELERREDDE